MSIQDYVVPGVSVAVYLICAAIKGLLGEKKKYLPLIAGVLGVILACWYSVSFNFPAFLSGLASGLGATGIDQAISIESNSQKVRIYDPKEEGIE